MIDSEPSLAAVVSGIELEDALSAIGEFAERWQSDAPAGGAAP